jgi:competence protein ComGC
MTFDEQTTLAACIVVMIIIACTFFFWLPYLYKDCKKVGHTTLYCIGTILK